MVPPPVSTSTPLHLGHLPACPPWTPNIPPLKPHQLMALGPQLPPIAHALPTPHPVSLWELAFQPSFCQHPEAPQPLPPPRCTLRGPVGSFTLQPPGPSRGGTAPFWLHSLPEFHSALRPAGQPGRYPRGCHSPQIPPLGPHFTFCLQLSHHPPDRKGPDPSPGTRSSHSAFCPPPLSQGSWHPPVLGKINSLPWSKVAPWPPILIPGSEASH